jgi:molybdenum cofactor biosynthesis protein B
MTTSHHQNVLARLHCAVLTVSDTRTPETDESGSWIRDRLVAAGHDVRDYEIVPDEPALVGQRVDRWCADGRVDAVLITGGTGVSDRDTTFEAVSGLLEKRLDGFGELFRNLSFQRIGPAALLSRAVAGVRGRTAVFSMPGSPSAVQLAVDRLILPTLGHLIALLRPGRSEGQLPLDDPCR